MRHGILSYVRFLLVQSEGDLEGGRKSYVSRGLLGGWEDRVLLPVMVKPGFQKKFFWFL